MEITIASLDLFSVCLRTTDHLNMKLLIFSGHTASFKIEVSEVQDFGNFELSPMCHVTPYTHIYYVHVISSISRTRSKAIFPTSTRN